MENWILREFDTTLIIAVYDGQWQLLTKSFYQHLTKANGLATDLTGRHVLYLSKTQSN